MATITGKRFQITDGASTPTNLFPYTVSEAVYGLSNTISNAISTALSALSLSTYAGTSQIGSSTQPVYYNGSALVATNLSTTYAPYNANGYLPLTGGTIKNGNAGTPLTLDTTSGTIGIYFATSATNKGWVGYQPTYGSVIYSQASSKYLGIKDDGTPHFQGNTLWHSGNSNLSTVPWACSTLTTSGTIQASGNVYCGAVFDLNRDGSSGTIKDSTKMGMEIEATASYIAFKPYTSSGAAWGTILSLSSSGNVGIGITSPSQKLHVEGSIYAAGGYRTNSALLGLFKGSGITSTLTENDGALYYYNHTLAVWANLFQIYGDIVSTGDQVISSDLTLKENLTPVTYSVSDIAKARAVEFDWKDGRGHSMGSIAQDWLGIAPALVHGEEGNMSLAYGQLALVNTIIEAREIETLKARVAELEAEVKRLRS